MAGTGPDPHLPVCVTQTLQILYGPDPDRPGLDPSNRRGPRHVATKGNKQIRDTRLSVAVGSIFAEAAAFIGVKNS